MNGADRTILVVLGVVLGVAVLMCGMMVGMLVILGVATGLVGGGWWVGGLAALLAVACVGLLAVGLGWYRLRRSRRARGSGPPAGPPGDDASAIRDARP